MRRLSRALLTAVALAVTVCTYGGAGTVALPAGKIVFTRADPHPSLYAMTADGTHVRLLVKNAADAVVSKDGRQIAFVRERAIWVMARDGTGQRRLTGPGSATDDGPAWSSDGTAVYFSRGGANGASSIFSIHEDGTGLHRLTAAHASGYDICSDNPSPSPDGRRIAFVRTDADSCAHGTNMRITAITPAGRPSSLAFRFPAGEYSPSSAYDPAWAANDRLLAYAFMNLNSDAKPPEPGSGIYVSKSDGSPPRRVYPGNYVEAPAWSSDGAWIAFADGDTHHIWLTRADRTQSRVLTSTKGEDGDPAWLPPLR
jgi:Tol biopolymer transport system component